MLKYTGEGYLTTLTLCTLRPRCHTCLFLPSSSCSMLPPSSLGLDCLSCSLSGGPALHPPIPLDWPHLPQVLGNALSPHRAQSSLSVMARRLFGRNSIRSSSTSSAQISVKTRFCRKGCCDLFLVLKISNVLTKFYQNCSKGLRVFRIFL